VRLGEVLMNEWERKKRSIEIGLGNSGFPSKNTRRSMPSNLPSRSMGRCSYGSPKLFDKVEPRLNLEDYR
jgi:hypothetical protein